MNIGRVGTGLRSSFSGVKATIFGARGFLGKHVTNELGRVGTTLFLPHHGCDMEMRHLKVMGDLGQVAIMPFYARDLDSIRRAVEGSDIVINLMGKHYETKHLVPGITNWSFKGVHVEAATNVAKVAKEMGVPRFIQHSSVLADLDSPSLWASTKAEGELAVREIYPNATIVRSSTLFGNEDRFLCNFATVAQSLKMVPLVDDGKAVLAPVYANDVAKAILKIVMHPPADGQTYELAGPDEYTYKEVVEYILETIQVPSAIVPVPSQLMEAAGGILNKFTNPLFTPPFTDDQVRQQTLDQIVDGSCPGLAELEIVPTRMEDIGGNVLYRFKPGGHFVEEAGYH